MGRGPAGPAIAVVSFFTAMLLQAPNDTQAVTSRRRTAEMVEEHAGDAYSCAIRRGVGTVRAQASPSVVGVKDLHCGSRCQDFASEQQVVTAAASVDEREGTSVAQPLMCPA